MGQIVFGDFELDAVAYELRRHGRPVRLERLPMELLLLLASRRGELVTRTEIVHHLWGEDVFIDVGGAVNTLVSKLRQVLHERPGRPRFLQTVAGKGYRFVAPIEAGRHGASPERVMLAVLPFQNLTGDPNQEYLTDGFTEETIAVLGGFNPQEMAVIARTSVMTYKQTAKTIATIGRELGVNHVIEGSVRREGSRLRVTVQLIRVADQTHLWSESYEQDAANLIAVQQELCRAIADRVRVRVKEGPERGADMAHRHRVAAEVYDQYLRGRYYWNQRTGPAIRHAIDRFRQALEVDPHYALALSGLADAFSILPITADEATRECLPQALAAAESAVASNEGCAEAHAALAACRFWMEWDWAAAEAAARRAIALQPNCAVAHLICGHVLSNSGRHADAEPEIRRAAQLDPVSTHMRAIYGQLLFQAHRYDEAMAQVRQALVLNPDAWIANVIKGKLLIQAGQYGEAQIALQHALDLSGGNTEALSLRGYAYAKAGNAEQARQVTATLEEMSRHRYVPPYNLAMIHAGLDESDRVVAWLDRAYEERDVRMVFLGVDPKWSKFLLDPRVRRLFPDPRFLRGGRTRATRSDASSPRGVRRDGH